MIWYLELKLKQEKGNKTTKNDEWKELKKNKNGSTVKLVFPLTRFKNGLLLPLFGFNPE